jgi:ABC-2 type transport system permease protein/oleandomycin transport system permease protein
MGILLGMGILIGFRIKTDVAGVIGALLLLVVMSFAVSWVSVLIGVLVSEPDKVQIFGFTTIFPLSFSSSAFVNIDTMPGWMQAWAKINPVSFLADATRGLLNGGPVASPVTKTLISAVVLAVIFAPLAVRALRRRV